jgi:hypothetical protein
MLFSSGFWFAYAGAGYQFGPQSQLRPLRDGIAVHYAQKQLSGAVPHLKGMLLDGRKGKHRLWRGMFHVAY